ncbi:TPA: hypothetical protein N0F65_000922 [Lagenidium giganteum]|uniref:Uncharacterized protein n=1 Tax=Lagenidium giganteum TaxID=4803 RepID=A0AAV2YM29_9STRA|nr:TPA: hypothetical protein N0F65_000922 [Lagenidium giganteum]
MWNPVGNSKLKASPLDHNAEFMDEHGTLRRSSTVTKRMVLRGTKVGKEEYLGDAELCGNMDGTQPPPSPTKAVAEDDQFLKEAKERKQKILDQQNEREQRRLEEWYSSVEADPLAETSPRNTSASPSRNSMTFVDEDGNIRRKSSAPVHPPSFTLPFEVPGPHRSMSTVIDLVEAMVDDI